MNPVTPDVPEPASAPSPDAPARDLAGTGLRVCFVSNFNTYYRQPVFAALAAQPDLDIDFVFYSKGGEKYWLPEHGVVAAERQTYLDGLSALGTRITPGIFPALFRKRYDVYLKCINGRFAVPVTYLVARLRRRPFVLWTEVWMRFRTPGHRLGWPLVQHIYRNADAIVACGDHVRDYLLSEGVKADRIVVARHAVDNARYAAEVTVEQKDALRRELDIPDGAPVVLFLGRLDPVKGLDDLLHAFAAALRDRPDDPTTLVMAGVGPDRAMLEDLAASLGIAGRIRWAGYIQSAETVRFYALATLMVLSSVELPYRKETWGLTVNEAMNQGVPVIATDAVGAAAGGLVAHGVTGAIVPARDRTALASALREIIDDPDLRARMSRASRNAVSGWTQAGMAASFAEAIRLGRANGS